MQKSVVATIVNVEEDLVRWNYSNNEPFPVFLRFNFSTGEIGCYVEVCSSQYSDQVSINIPPLSADGANALMEWAKESIEEFINSHDSIYSYDLHELACKIEEVAHNDYAEYVVRIECEYEKEFYNYSDIAEQYKITSSTTDEQLEKIRIEFESDCQANETGTVKFFDSLEFLERVRESVSANQ